MPVPWNTSEYFVAAELASEHMVSTTEFSVAMRGDESPVQWMRWYVITTECTSAHFSVMRMVQVLFRKCCYPKMSIDEVVRRNRYYRLLIHTVEFTRMAKRTSSGSDDHRGPTSWGISARSTCRTILVALEKGAHVVSFNVGFRRHFIASGRCSRTCRLVRCRSRKMNSGIVARPKWGSAFRQVMIEITQITRFLSGCCLQQGAVDLITEWYFFAVTLADHR